MNTEHSFFEAIKSGDVEKVRELLLREPTLRRERMPSGETPILLAKYYGRDEIIEFLFSQHTNITLHEAAAIGNAEIVRSIIGAQPESIDTFSHDGYTALQLAVFFGYAPIVEFLLAHRANVNLTSRNPMKISALHSAVAKRNFALAKMLLDASANVDAKQVGGFTPMHGAAFQGDLEMVTLLLDHHADTTAKTDDGKTAFMLAKEMAHIEVMELLKKVDR